MTALISVRNSDGEVGRCDAKCYNAKTANCNCVCGGKNHGAGLKQAMENTRELADSWIAEYAARKYLTEFTVETSQSIYQLSLF